MFLIKIWKNKRNSLSSSEKLKKINNNFYDIIPTGFFTLYNSWVEIQINIFTILPPPLPIPPLTPIFEFRFYIS